MRSIHGLQLILVTGLGVLIAAEPVSAAFHLWKPNEVFSNEDGTIQYIEFYSTSERQHFLAAARNRQIQPLLFHALQMERYRSRQRPSITAIFTGSYQYLWNRTRTPFPSYKGR